MARLSSLAVQMRRCARELLSSALARVASIESHLEGMREGGDLIPEPTTQVDHDEVAWRPGLSG